jgi:hypothetical protein
MGVAAAGTAAVVGTTAAAGGLSLGAIAPAIGGIASAAGSLLGSKAGAAGSQAAADAQLQMYQQARADLSPFTSAGQSVLPDLTTLAQGGPNGPGGTNFLAQAQGMLPGQMTEAELVQTPGYQFNLAQGLQSTQNSAAARGLGVSGAAMKGAATYATGLADSTYQNQFNNAQTRFSDVGNLNQIQQGNLTSQFSKLYDVARLGENAGAQTATTGATLAGNQGNFLQTAGQTTGAGYAGVGNAINSGLQNYLSYNAMMANAPAGTSGYANA